MAAEITRNITVSATCTILSTVLLSMLTPCVDEIIGQLFIRLQEYIILSGGES